MNTENQMRALVMLQAMIVEADKFHLSVAKALLSPKPLSEQQRVALLDAVAKRESRHEQQEQLFQQAVQLLKNGAA